MPLFASRFNIYYSPCQSIHFLLGCTCACLCLLLDLTYITHHVRVFIFCQQYSSRFNIYFTMSEYLPGCTPLFASRFNIYYSPCQSIHFLPECTCACLCLLLDLTYITHHVRVFIFSQDVRVHALVCF